MGIAAVALPAAFATSQATAQLPFPRDCVMPDGTEIGDGSVVQAFDPQGNPIVLICRRGHWAQP